MPSAESLLVVASALIIFILGALHLLLTYRSRWFYPRDPDLESQMKAVAPLISQETTMWRAGIGFHASHSAGAILFSLAYAYLALEPTQLLFKSPFLLFLGLAYLALVAILCSFTGFASRSGAWHWQLPSTPALSLRTGPNQTMSQLRRHSRADTLADVCLNFP
jgi:hypothetical protein